MIKLPAIFLCFDDCHIDEWYGILGFLKQFNMRCTFYISNLQRITDEQWTRLHKIKDAGHTIGHHTLSHAKVKDYSNIEDYIQYEINKASAIFLQHNFGTQHFCYPYGNRTKESDEKLSAIFKTIRVGGRESYDIQGLKSLKFMPSADFGKIPSSRFCGHENYLDMIIEQKRATSIHMHKPVMHRLEYLADLRGNVHFLPMSVLDR